MKIGIGIPEQFIGFDPAVLRDYAVLAEELGFDYLTCVDHVLGATHDRRDPPFPPGGIYTEASVFHEPLTLFAYLAALTSRIELVSAVLVLPQRQTALVAKQAAEVDILTGGRLRLGIGLGWNAVEYEALGEDFANRGKRAEEQIELLRRLWQEPVVTFDGEWHRVTAAGINPLPVQRPIPVWIGAATEPARRRAARIADGFFPFTPAGVKQSPLEAGWDRTIAQLHGWLREEGRDPAAFGIEPRVNVGVGTPDEWRRDVDEWRAIGATHLSLNTMAGGFRGPDAHVARLREALAVLA